MGMNVKYREFADRIAKFIEKDRVYTDELRRFAWGTDAGFYRLTPQVVVRGEAHPIHELPLPVLLRSI